MSHNPPAFPRTGEGFGNPLYDTPGMTLRDWFATFAPAPSESAMGTQRGIDRSRNPHNDPHKPRLRSDEEIRAALAYRYADAMLAERAKGDGK